MLRRGRQPTGIPALGGGLRGFNLFWNLQARHDFVSSRASATALLRRCSSCSSLISRVSQAEAQNVGSDPKQLLPRRLKLSIASHPKALAMGSVSRCFQMWEPGQKDFGALLMGGWGPVGGGVGGQTAFMRPSTKLPRLLGVSVAGFENQPVFASKHLVFVLAGGSVASVLANVCQLFLLADAKAGHKHAQARVHTSGCEHARPQDRSAA